MKKIPHLSLILSMQVISILTTALILLFDWRWDLTHERSQLFGQNLTVFLVILGIICHVKAGKGLFYPALTAALVVIPPLYASLSGLLHHVIGYHMVALGFHALTLWNLNKFRQKAGEGPEPAGREKTPGKGIEESADIPAEDD